MRPGIGPEVRASRSRKSSGGDATRPTSFFLTRDPDLLLPSETPDLVPDHDTSPVRTLKETIDEATTLSRNVSFKHKQQEARSTSRRRSTIRVQTVDGIKQEHQQPQSRESPISFIAHTPSIPSREISLPGSPKSTSSRSLQKSDAGSVLDDVESQAIASEDEKADDIPSETQDSMPQLIMPSIRMPNRRPFTVRGRQIGKFKILVTGSKGCGRTSLVKSIVQLCEDIVHVDPMPAPSAARYGIGTSGSTIVSELYASTKPYPVWWSEVDDSRLLKRRKSVGNSVLERNICFVDAPDSGTGDNVIHHLEQQFLQVIESIKHPGADLARLLGGVGSSQVDVILYLMTKETWKRDCDRIRRMSTLAIIIPLIGKADTLSVEQLSDLKASTELWEITLPHLPFGEQTSSVLARAPYTVSSANGPDIDNMDASLLMSPEYVQPLMPSELEEVVQHLFEPSSIAYFRQTTARKLVTWYNSEPRLTQIASPSLRSVQPSTLNSPFHASVSNFGVLVPAISEVSLNTSNSYALAKVADHAQREERLAQIRLSKWATDLQLSLQRERERYESIARNERAFWLVQRMGEEVRDGQVVPLEASHAMVRKSDSRKGPYADTIRHEVHDPLGLLRWQDAMRTRGWIALQLIGSFGVVGGVALWFAKTWGLTSSLYEWAQDWNERWCA